MVRRAGNIATASLVALVTAVMLFAMPARAVTMSTGEIVTVIFPAPAGNLNLAADATIKLFSLSASTAVFDVDLHNGTTLDPLARIPLFGFLLSPSPTATLNIAVTDTSATDIDAFVQGRTPDNVPGITTENVCFSTGALGPLNCPSGALFGLQNGERDLFRFSLSGSFGSSLDISDIGIRWQACRGCSFDIVGIATKQVTVPEPASLLLLGVGLLGMMGIRWHKRRNVS